MARLSARVRRCPDPRRADRRVAAAPADRLARRTGRPGLHRPAAGARVRVADPRLRQHRPVPHRPTPGRRRRVRRARRGGPRAGSADRPGRRVQPRRSRSSGGRPGAPGGAGRRGGPAAGHRVGPPGRAAAAGVRGPRLARPARPRRRRGGRLRHRRHDALARPRDRRVAAGCGLLGARGVLGPRPAPGAREVPRRLDPRRGAARGLRRDRGARRPGFGHPVRAVEGDLVVDQGPQLLRAGLVPAAAQRLSAAVPAADVRRQPRRHPDRQPDRAGAGADRPGRPADRRRHPVDLLRGRARPDRRQGGAPGWGRRGPPGLPRLPRRSAPHRDLAYTRGSHRCGGPGRGWAGR